MSVEHALSPPQDEGVEEEPIGFDYGLLLEPGEEITSVMSLTCVAHVGCDPEARERFHGAPVVVPSKRTGAQKAMVRVLFGGARRCVSYRLQCVVRTNGRQKLSIITHI